VGADEIFRPKRLEFDGPNTAFGGLAHQLLGDVELAFVVVADLSNDQELFVQVYVADPHVASGLAAVFPTCICMTYWVFMTENPRLS